MGFLTRLKTLGIASFTRQRGGTHQARLEEYYAPQAELYDEFREGLLHGRRELLELLPIKPGDKIVELGGGTGWNAEALGDRLALCESYVVVDLCQALLSKATARIERKHWSNVFAIHGDAGSCLSAKAPFDVVICSYSLTMMPQWFQVVDHAWRLLRPGGIFAATDFYVSQPFPAAGMRRHCAWQRWFWPLCFAWHHVFLSPDHLPYLQSRFETVYLRERLGSMPFMAGMKAPFYVFVGRKPALPFRLRTNPSPQQTVAIVDRRPVRAYIAGRFHTVVLTRIDFAQVETAPREFASYGRSDSFADSTHACRHAKRTSRPGVPPVSPLLVFRRTIARVSPRSADLA